MSITQKNLDILLCSTMDNIYLLGIVNGIIYYKYGNKIYEICASDSKPNAKYVRVGFELCKATCLFLVASNIYEASVRSLIHKFVN